VQDSGGGPRNLDGPGNHLQREAEGPGAHQEARGRNPERKQSAGAHQGKRRGLEPIGKLVEGTPRGNSLRVLTVHLWILLTSCLVRTACYTAQVRGWFTFSLGCQTGGLNNRKLFSHSSGVWESTLKVSAVAASQRPLSLACPWPPSSCVLMWPSLCPCSSLVSLPPRIRSPVLRPEPAAFSFLRLFSPRPTRRQLILDLQWGHILVDPLDGENP